MELLSATIAMFNFNVAIDKNTPGVQFFTIVHNQGTGFLNHSKHLLKIKVLKSTVSFLSRVALKSNFNLNHLYDYLDQTFAMYL